VVRAVNAARQYGDRRAAGDEHPNSASRLQAAHRVPLRHQHHPHQNKEIGIASTPDRSFTLTKSDTVASVQAAYRRRCAASRGVMMELTLDDVVDGRGQRTVWALYLQVLRELAQHVGHADILREQVLAGPH